MQIFTLLSLFEVPLNLQSERVGNPSNKSNAPCKGRVNKNYDKFAKRKDRGSGREESKGCKGFKDFKDFKN